MGLADRDYHRNPPPQEGGALAQLTPVVKWLLIANLGIYFLDTFMKGAAADGPIRRFGAFAIQSAIYEGRIWEFLTFQFIHGSVGHVLFNCIALFFFGPWLERWWGTRKFLIFYLLCGVGGAAFFTLLVFAKVLGDSFFTGLVGASAGIYGILIGVAMVAPGLRVRLLLPPIELTMRQLAMVILAIAIGSIVLRLGGNEGGEAGHLGGAIVGFLLMRHPRLLGSREGVSIVPPPVVRRVPREAKIRPRSAVERQQETRVDEILDKISREGFQSLTPEEREFLQNASNSSK